MAYNQFIDTPSLTAFGGSEGCVECSTVVVDATYDKCDAQKALDADDVLILAIKCSAVFQKDDGATGREPLDATIFNPEDVQSFTDLVTSGDIVVIETQDFDKPVAEEITVQLSGYKPETVTKKRQNFTWKTTRRLATGAEAKLFNQIANWSDNDLLHIAYVSKHDDVRMIRETTKYSVGDVQTVGLESIEMYEHNTSTIYPKNRIVVPFRIAGLYKELKALAL